MPRLPFRNRESIRRLGGHGAFRARTYFRGKASHRGHRGELVEALNDLFLEPLPLRKLRAMLSP
jgi:hypothetical protein